MTKKIKIKHLSKKSWISKKKLKSLFLENWIIESFKEKFVYKDVAKTFLRDVQWINEYWYSKMWFFEDFWSKFRFASLFGLIWTVWLFWLLFSLASDTWSLSWGGIVDHEVASVVSDNALVRKNLQRERFLGDVQQEIFQWESLSDDQQFDGFFEEDDQDWFKKILNDVSLWEVTFTHDSIQENEVHFVPPERLPDTWWDQ